MRVHQNEKLSVCVNNQVKWHQSFKAASYGLTYESEGSGPFSAHFPITPVRSTFVDSAHACSLWVFHENMSDFTSIQCVFLTVVMHFTSLCKYAVSVCGLFSVIVMVVVALWSQK